MMPTEGDAVIAVRVEDIKQMTKDIQRMNKDLTLAAESLAQLKRLLFREQQETNNSPVPRGRLRKPRLRVVRGGRS